MNSKLGFSLPIILAIVAVVLVGTGVVAFLYITNSTNPALESSAYTPAQQPIEIPKADEESGFKPAATATPAASPVTSPSPTPVFSNSPIPTGQVNTSTSLSTDKKTFTINFLSTTDFAGITSISYTLTYTADSGQQKVTGTITVASETIATNSDGQQYIRKTVTVGTCSGTNCTYDTNPKNFRLSLSIQ